jgi:ssDNA-binding replication factor A large subunit
MIESIRPGQNVSLQAKVKYMGLPEKVRGNLTKLEVVIADNTDEILLVLWNDSSGIAVGNEISLADAWCQEWKGTRQLSLGKRGRMEIIREP